MKRSTLAAILSWCLIFAIIGGVGYLIFHEESVGPENSDQTAQTEGDGTVTAGTKLPDYTPVAEVNELQIIDLVEGSGQAVVGGDTITAHYTGATASDGTIFQTSHDRGEPVQFSLSQVIPGWTEGVPGMKVGGQRRLLIPAEKAYGQNPPPGSGIPPGAALVFDIELVSVP